MERIYRGYLKIVHIRQRVGKEHGFSVGMQGMVRKVNVGHSEEVGRTQIRKIY